MGRHIFGFAALLLGVAGLVLQDQLISSWQLPGAAAFVAITSLAQIAGGAAMLFGRTARTGAATLGVVYLISSLTFVPGIAAEPGVYASWGNVFYQLALVAGAMAAYGLSAPSGRSAFASSRSAVILFGLCNVSFAIEQVEFLARTASLVPVWIPPSGTFWAIATTVAFALAGLALVVGYRSLLASRLLSVMLLVFGVTIWVPILIADPKTHSNWSEGIETFAIAGAAWLVADFLASLSRAR
jgi:uncharacterized membrane protein YphA (DoxX/SURF4 family)